MAQHPSGGDVPCGAAQQGAQVQDALARKAAAAEGVLVPLSPEAAVGVAAAGPGKNQGKVRCAGALRLDDEPWLDHPVTGGDKAGLFVDPGPVHGMQHGADQLPCRAGAEAAVAVQGQQKADAPERGRVSDDGESTLLPGAEGGQLQQGAPLALKAGPELPVKGTGTGKEIEAAAVAGVQRFDPGF